MCVTDIFSKYAWVVPLNNKKGVSIVNYFPKILDDSNRKPNKIWVDKGEFYNSSFKEWINDNDIEMYSINNQGKSVVAERFIRNLTTKISNPNQAGLVRGSFWAGGEGGGVKLPSPPSLKLVRIILEASKSARKYTPIYSFRKYIL